MEDYCEYYDCFIDDINININYSEIDCDLCCESCYYRSLELRT